jgi:Bacterial SH3 domain
LDSILGSRFKIKYKQAGLHMGPSVTYSVYGNLKKGAVVDVIEDASAYYYKVRLDNGLEGYVYKPSGDFTSLPLTKVTDKELLALAAYSGVVPPAQTAESPSIEIPAASGTTRTATRRTTVIRSANGRPPARTVSESATSRLTPTSMNVEITSAEIAVFDNPGIIGRQVAKLRRGEKVGLVSQDGFFYQVKLANGIVGYIPRYAAENR